jgi:hypothetical protein
MLMSRTTSFVAAVLVGASVLAACGGGGSKEVSLGIGTKTVARHDVETKAAAQLAATVNQPTPTVTCPGDLTAKVGATLDCTLTTAADPTPLPVHIVVDTVSNGDAQFTAQVGQAAGGGDKAAFCADNKALDEASAGATQASDLPPILKANLATIDDFRTKAPADIVDVAGTLAKVATDAAASGDASAFNDQAIADAGKKVDAYCGQNSDGSPVDSGFTATTDAGTSDAGN